MADDGWFPGKNILELLQDVAETGGTYAAAGPKIALGAAETLKNGLIDIIEGFLWE